MTDWWLFIDLGGGDRITQADEKPGPEWTGPYSTFTEARQAAIFAITVERDEIQERLTYWRLTNKRNILADCLEITDEM